MNIEAAILAGGTLDAEFAASVGVSHRWQLAYRGDDFLEIALRATRPICSVTIIGGEPREGASQKPGGSTFLESFARSLEGVTTSHVLVLSADMPFIQEEHLRRFLEKCDASAAVNYSVSRTDIVDAKFPGLKRTSIRTREGEFTGGNAFLLNVEVIRRELPRVQGLYSARKSPLKLAQLLGFGTLFALCKALVAPRLVGIADLERTVGKSVGLKVKAVISGDPEIATDIDNSSQYAWLMALEKRS